MRPRPPLPIKLMTLTLSSSAYRLSLRKFLIKMLKAFGSFPKMLHLKMSGDRFFFSHTLYWLKMRGYILSNNQYNQSADTLSISLVNGVNFVLLYKNENHSKKVKIPLHRKSDISLIRGSEFSFS